MQELFSVSNAGKRKVFLRLGKCSRVIQEICYLGARTLAGSLQWGTNVATTVAG